MNIYRSHILVPVDENTTQAGALQIKKVLEEELKKRNLTDEVKVVETGTVGLIGRGVILVFYPERVYYYDLKASDIPFLVEEHLIKGRVAKNLPHNLTDFSAVPEKQEVGLVRKQHRIVLDKCWKVNPENIEEVIAAGGYAALEKIFTEKI